ncbi:DNA glycosylase [Nemania sp. FL0916]|nr:DNA glycosylase [Nemania sp. FL0916]
MSGEKETGDHDAVAADIPKEPSFHGRLQLGNFAFNGAAGETTAPAGQSVTSKAAAGAVAARKRRQNPPDDDNDARSPSPSKKRGRVSASYAPPSTYAHLPELTDVITPNLLVLFIGLNPGVQTARSGHAYAHPSNLFWKLLYSSGLTTVPCKPEEDGTLPARFSLGNTNIVARPSRNGAELSRAEMDAGVAILDQKCRRWRPEAVCVVGKSIWESIFRVRAGRNLAKGDKFEYGWQTERLGAAADDTPWEGSRIFVATSTSGLAASLSLEEKQRIWKILGDWCNQRRKERAEAEEKIKAEPEA